MWSFDGFRKARTGRLKLFLHLKVVEIIKIDWEPENDLNQPPTNLSGCLMFVGAKKKKIKKHNLEGHEYTCLKRSPQLYTCMLIFLSLPLIFFIFLHFLFIFIVFPNKHVWLHPPLAKTIHMPINIPTKWQWTKSYQWI